MSAVQGGVWSVGAMILFACDLLGGQAGGSDASAHSDAKSADAEAREGGGGDHEADGDGGAQPDGDGAGSSAEGDASRVAWHVQLDSVPRSAAVTDRGTIFTLAEDGLHGFVDGKPAWDKQGSFAGITRLIDGGVVTTTGATVIAFDPSTGEERFRVDVPAPPGWPTTGRKGEPIPPPAVIASASFGSQLLVADQEARFFQVDPPTCIKGEPACLRPAGALEGEVLEVGTRLIVADDGTRYLIEEDTMRVFDQALETVFELESPGRIVSIVPAGQSGLALAANGQVALLQMPRCAGATLRLPSVPTGSKHCFRWRYGIDLDDAAPAVIDENTLAVNGGRRMHAATEGTDSWKSPIGSVGPVLVGSDQLLYTLAVEEEGEPALSVKAVHPRKGTVEWTVPLPFAPSAAPAGAEGEAAAESVIPETTVLDTRGGWIVAGVDQHVALVAVQGSADGS